MNIVPTSNRVLLKRLPAPQKGLIIIPDSALEIERRAQVLAVGPKCKDVKKGDIVWLPGSAAEQPDLAKDGTILVTENDIGAVIAS